LGARGLLRSLLRKLRAAFPAATFRVRLDGGFASPKLFTFLEREQVEYVVAMASNRRLEKRARRLMGRARVLSRQTGKTAHLYGETRYAAKKWTRRRRVIIKAEVVRHPGRAPKNNPRFVVTNLPAPPQTVYQFYCQRGDVENRLKELHQGLEMDRTSCSTFRANQFRVLLTLAAYILYQELRRRAATTACADAQVTTLRERLIKLAVWVERSVRRIVLHLPRASPWLPTWRQLARTVGATP
jgi:Transposase DDE domain group 1